VAEIAVRVYTNGGDAERAVDWVGKALAESRGSAALNARLVAARAAWDRSDPAAMDGYLGEAAEAVHDPDLAWRWHHARGLRALLDADGAGAVESFARALRASRRRLARHEAAGLWNDVGLGRAQAGDLAGAERAFLHVCQLYAGCDGPRKTTLGPPNLAEIRLRRGRLPGVREILVRSSAENRLAGNLRGLVQDTELWARFELAQGRAEAALALCHAARGIDVSWRRAEIAVLAARALGWLGRAAEAAAELERVTPEAILEQLEPEERPALWAHAGLSEAAFASIEEGASWNTVWRGLLVGAPPPTPVWEGLAGLEPFRAARLVFDAERLLPGSAPPHWLRAAVATFRQMGATAFVERLEGRRGEVPLSDCGPLATLIAAAARDIAEALDPPGEAAAPAWSGRGGIVGESPGLQAALDRIARLAPGDLPLLLLGESGTGKELAAHLVHRTSPRSRSPFVAVNCAAFSETLLLSDLFGHVRGAFTGADRDRAGVFETAQKGTVFLDEIGDLPPVAQGMLLRVLQEGEVRRVGESVPRKVDVRVIAATHRDLALMVAEGTFRQDLFYRLKVASVVLPPLRERGDDVLRLADHILESLPRAGRLSREARARLLGYRWPGNVRELRNVLSVASALSGHTTIGPEHLELSEGAGAADTDYHQQVDAFRRRLVRDAMAASGGNRTEAARRLGLSRQTLSYLVRQLGLC
jgi:two-component system NtrC family response regulator